MVVAQHACAEEHGGVDRHCGAHCYARACSGGGLAEVEEEESGRWSGRGG